MIAYVPFAARLKRVVDGDTVILDVDLGFKIRADITVRLHGINAPEKDTEEGKAAMAFVTMAFAQNSDVALRVFGPDKYGGRWQGEILLNAASLAGMLVAAGLAKPWDGKGVRPT